MRRCKRYLLMVFSQERSKLQTQTYLHHAIGISGFVSAVAYGRGGALIISVRDFSISNTRKECPVDQRIFNFFPQLQSVPSDFQKAGERSLSMECHRLLLRLLNQQDSLQQHCGSVGRESFLHYSLLERRSKNLYLNHWFRSSHVPGGSCA